MSDEIFSLQFRPTGLNLNVCLIVTSGIRYLQRNTLYRVRYHYRFTVHTAVTIDTSHLHFSKSPYYIVSRHYSYKVTFTFNMKNFLPDMIQSKMS